MRIAIPLLVLLLLPLSAKADTIVDVSSDVGTVANLDLAAGTFEANYVFDVTTDTFSDLTYQMSGGLAGFVYAGEDNGRIVDFDGTCNFIGSCYIQLDFEDHDEPPFPASPGYYGPWDVEFYGGTLGVTGYVTVSDPAPEPSESILLAIGLMGLLAGCVFLERRALYVAKLMGIDDATAERH